MSKSSESKSIKKSDKLGRSRHDKTSTKDAAPSKNNERRPTVIGEVNVAPPPAAAAAVAVAPSPEATTDDAQSEAKRRRQLVVERNYEYVSDYGFYDPLVSGSIDGTDERAHDRALVRALRANYRPPIATPQKDVAKTLFVGRLAYATDNERLRVHFELYGRVRTATVVRDLVTGLSRGYAFVEFRHGADARYAHAKAHGSLLDGCELVVEFEHERRLIGWRPRRLGGGLGGQKKSGQLRFGGRARPFARIHRRAGANSFAAPLSAERHPSTRQPVALTHSQDRSTSPRMRHAAFAEKSTPQHRNTAEKTQSDRRRGDDVAERGSSTATSSNAHHQHRRNQHRDHDRSHNRSQSQRQSLAFDQRRH